MKRVYWSDRENNPAPDDALFHLRSFFSSSTESFQTKKVELPSPKTYKAIRKSYYPEKKDWEKGVVKALELIDQEILQKVVLARAVVLEFNEPLDPFAITAALQKKSHGSFIYCFDFGDFAFLGASPERLFKREDTECLSEAIAGTRRRGSSQKEDEELKQELLLSEKDLREFVYVRTYIQNALFPLSHQLPDVTPTSVHLTPNVQHLYSQISARLKNSISDEKILDKLHPTPALCGLPKTAAKKLIKEVEPFDRFLYGGAIGWTSKNSSEWVVAIRSLLIKGNTATLFSGTGIVEGSNPDLEWNELDEKIKLYDGILDH